jgi:hypothetical protein
MKLNNFTNEKYKQNIRVWEIKKKHCNKKGKFERIP